MSLAKKIDNNANSMREGFEKKGFFSLWGLTPLRKIFKIC